jgi:hypothetical protein
VHDHSAADDGVGARQRDLRTQKRAVSGAADAAATRARRA